MISLALHMQHGLGGEVFLKRFIVNYPYVICKFLSVTLLLNLTTPELVKRRKRREVPCKTSKTPIATPLQTDCWFRFVKSKGESVVRRILNLSRHGRVEFRKHAGWRSGSSRELLPDEHRTPHRSITSHTLEVSSNGPFYY